MNCVQVTLGLEGLGYVRSRLATGNAFSGFLLQQTQRETAEVSALLPEPYKAERLTFFDLGGIASLTNARICAAALIAHELETPTRVCLLEDALGNRADPGVRRRVSDHCFYGKEVYHYLSSANSSKPQVLRALQEAETLPVFVGAICSLPSGMERPSPNCDLTEMMLKTFAYHAYKLIVGAYDGEGYVVWTKPAQTT